MWDLVDRVLLVGFEETGPPDWLRRAAPGLGGVVLYGQNLQVDGDVARLAAGLHAGSDVVVAIDEEGGDVTRLHYRSGSTTPGNHVLGAADDPALTAAVAGGIGRELAAAGVGWNLAPSVDVNSAPDNPVIGVRAFGADPVTVSRHARTWIGALQATGVAACAKHFPGHGDTTDDSHLGLPVVGCTEAEWRAVHLPPFAAAIEAGVHSVMTAHVVLPVLDVEPATMSRRLLTGVLRGELGFDGVIVTDALDMGAIRDTIGEAAGAVAALRAGADALCLGAVGGEALYQRVRTAVHTAVEAGDLPRTRLAEAAARVERLHATVLKPRFDVAGPTTAGRGTVPAPAMTAARAAAVARGIEPLGSPPFVVELRGAANLAVGDAPWSMKPALEAVGGTPVDVRVVGEGRPEALGDALIAAAGHPLVVVGRDVVRHGWQRAAWVGVVAERPDAVLVDLGLPRPDALAALGGTHHLLVGGAARPNLLAAAELLTKRADQGRPGPP